MSNKYKILTDKHGWYFQEPNTDICTMISALNALKFFNVKIKKSEINDILKSLYKNDLGIMHQDFLSMLTVLNLRYDIGFHDINYIKHILDNDSPVIIDNTVLEIQNEGIVLSHIMLITKYKIKNKKTYLFCTNMSHKTGSKWVPWTKIKKCFVKFNKKSFCKNVCLGILGISKEEN